jgi:hypothetical protein
MGSTFPRRRFLQTAAAGGLLATRLEADVPPAQSNVAPSDRVRFGMIGIGMQGSGPLSTAINLPGVERAGAADLWEGRHALAKEITNNPSLPTTRRYQELLDRKDIDCMVAAVPERFRHARLDGGHFERHLAASGGLPICLGAQRRIHYPKCEGQ